MSAFVVGADAPGFGALADMATELDAARLLVYRSAWLKDHGAERVTRKASIREIQRLVIAGQVRERAAAR